MRNPSNQNRARNDRPFGFQNLTVYRKMLEYIELEHQASRSFPAILRDQLDRAADSIILNFAEGAGKKPGSKDRARFYGISRASATESVGGWDVARVRGHADPEICGRAQDLLSTITAMLSRMR